MRGDFEADKNGAESSKKLFLKSSADTVACFLMLFI